MGSWDAVLTLELQCHGQYDALINFGCNVYYGLGCPFRPHPPTPVAPPLWLPSDRRTQDPGAAEFPPSGSCRPGAAPCRARCPAAAPGPDRVPAEEPQNQQDSAAQSLTMVTLQEDGVLT